MGPRPACGPGASPAPPADPGPPRGPGGAPPVSFRDACRFWMRLGCVNFGGPAGQIALMHRELVERRGWIGADRFLHALNFCMILPGPEAQQLATYVGWRLHGARGAVVAGAFFVIPSVFVLLFLSWLAAAHAEVPAIAGLLYGLQPAVVAIVAEAVIRIGRRALHGAAAFALAAAAFAAIRLFGVPFPAIVAAAAVAGALLHRLRPGALGIAGGGAGDHRMAGAAAPTRPSVRRAAGLVALFAILWALPVGALVAWDGGGPALRRVALFFTQAAFVTFGGAYAVLAYVAEAAVNRFGWLSAAQMVQGLALAESTPGPLIMVTQYVGFFAGWNQPGPAGAGFSAIACALVTTWVTFLPSFLFVLLGAPHIEGLASARRLRAALAGVTAAVVGVVLNLGVVFGARVLFPGGAGAVTGGADPFALAVAAIAFAALLRFRVPLQYLVALAALAGMVYRLSAGG